MTASDTYCRFQGEMETKYSWCCQKGWSTWARIPVVLDGSLLSITAHWATRRHLNEGAAEDEATVSAVFQRGVPLITCLGGGKTNLDQCGTASRREETEDFRCERVWRCDSKDRRVRNQLRDLRKKQTQRDPLVFSLKAGNNGWDGFIPIWHERVKLLHIDSHSFFTITSSVLSNIDWNSCTITQN